MMSRESRSVKGIWSSVMRSFKRLRYGDAITIDYLLRRISLLLPNCKRKQRQVSPSNDLCFVLSFYGRIDPNKLWMYWPLITPQLVSDDNSWFNLFRADAKPLHAPPLSHELTALAF